MFHFYCVVYTKYKININFKYIFLILPMCFSFFCNCFNEFRV